MWRSIDPWLLGERKGKYGEGALSAACSWNAGREDIEKFSCNGVDVRIAHGRALIVDAILDNHKHCVGLNFRAVHHVVVLQILVGHNLTGVEKSLRLHVEIGEFPRSVLFRGLFCAFYRQISDYFLPV